MRDRSTRGFTLIELMVTVAILGVLMALSTAALQGLRPRAELASAAAEISNAFKAARHHAQATNSQVWFGLRVPSSADGEVSLEYVVIEDPDYDFQNDPWPTPADDFGRARVIRQGRFPETIVGLTEAFGGWGEVPAEFRPPQDDLVAWSGCSFCHDGDGSYVYGWMVALPRGEIRVLRPMGGEANVEGLILTSFSRDTSNLESPVMVVFSSPFGLTETYRLDP